MKTMISTMRVIRRFLWFVLLFHGFTVALDLEAYIKRKEDQVKLMAAEIVRLDGARCALASNCSTSSCSRHACTPIEGFDDLGKYNFSCQQQQNPSSYCTSSGGNCNSRKVNYAMSYMRMAPNATLSQIPDAMCSTICMTRDLTSMLRTLANVDQFDETFYFGSIEGVQRVFPGEETQTDICWSYDPRKRPWYNGAISVQKHLSVLIDHGYVTQNQVPSPLLSAIDASKRMVRELMYTLSPSDVVNVIGFNENNANPLSSYPVLVPDDVGRGLKGEMKDLYDDINNSIPTQKSIGSTSQGFIKGISTALQPYSYTGDFLKVLVPDDVGRGLKGEMKDLYDDINNIIPTQKSIGSSSQGFIKGISTALQPYSYTGDFLKVILLVTNGVFATDLKAADINQVSKMLKNQSTHILIYSFDTSDRSDNLKALANESGGYIEILNTNFDNPLYQISSYFNFMALTRNASTKDTPYWTKYYVDFNGLSNIITVSYQAISPKGHLLGVTAIDIMLESVLTYLPTALGNRSASRPTYPNALLGSLEPTNSCCESCDGSKAVCGRTSNKIFTQLYCCDTCSVVSSPENHGSRKWSLEKIVIAAVVPASVLALALIALLIYKRITSNKPLQYPPIPVESPYDMGPYS